MEIKWDKELTKTSYQLMREAGYIPITDRATQKQSYIFRLAGNRYPRFHVYVKEESDDSIHLHLHLDNRQHGWSERLHDTEYESERVAAEAQRLQRWLQHFTVKNDAAADQASDDKGFFSKLFG